MSIGWPRRDAAAPFVDEPKNYGIGFDVPLGEDTFGVFQAMARELTKAARRAQEEDAAHILHFHVLHPEEHPACRWCNPPAPPAVAERGPECQTWTEGEVSITRHVADCTCHADCYDDYDW